MKSNSYKRPEFWVAVVFAVITTINPGAGLILALVLSIPLLNSWEWLWGGTLCGLGIVSMIELVKIFL